MGSASSSVQLAKDRAKDPNAIKRQPDLFEGLREGLALEKPNPSGMVCEKEDSQG